MNTTLPVKRRLEMPFLLLCGFGLSALSAILGSIIFIGIAIAFAFASSPTVNGHPATRAQLFDASWPIAAVFPPMLFILAAIAYALWRELHWSRLTMLAFWGANLLVNVALSYWDPAGTTDLGTIVFAFAIIVPIGWWYLYRKAAVVAYYDALKESAQLASAG